jgi:hypothetical protein
MTRLDVWVPKRDRARVLLALESLDALDHALFQLPVTVNGPGSGPLFSVEQRPGGPTVLGFSTGYDVFGKPGWTPERFAEFVTSRRHLHVFTDGNPGPTLAALAGYLQSPLLVDETYPTGARELDLITTDGNVAILRLDGGRDDSADLIRETFFTDGLDSALAVPGWLLTKAGPPTYSFLNAAFQRRMDLAVWKGRDELGKIAVPKGAKLIPLNMVIVDHEDISYQRPVIGHTRSSKHLYEIIVPALDELGPLEVTCAVDGVLQRFIDPATGEDKGLGAHAADWADWILRHSVPDGHDGLPPAGQPWEGNGTDARLYRLANNIVDYEDHDTDTTYFSTAGDVEAWLRRALGHHNAPLTVRVLDDVSFTLEARDPALIQNHTFDRSDGPDIAAGYQAAAFQPWAGKKNWWNPERLAYTRNPSLHTVTDGQMLQAFTAANCLDYADLEPYLLPVDSRANENSWFVVRLGDTPTCIAFPSQRTILTVSTDHDGAAAEITAHNYFRWVGQQGRKNGFAKQWARWLDESLPLTTEEIQDGLKVLEQIIERSDDEPDDE